MGFLYSVERIQVLIMYLYNQYNSAYGFSSQNNSRSFNQFRSYNSNGLTLTWENVNVEFKKSFPRKYKHILKNQLGKVSHGQLVALLGSSGSGKTTLLNALSFRQIRNLKVTGDIKINGVEMTRNDMLSVSAFVQQEDIFIGTLTVREHLMFHAMLRMERSISKKEKEYRVNQLIQELMLMKCENSLIGVPGKLKGISGGEKKRLSFATEILNNPMLLFCDEPTSGLDSAMAYSVVDSLKKIVESGKTVLTTIHQPSSEIFFMFDYLYVLYDGYLALAGSRDEVLKFLANNMNLRMPQNFNPADFILNSLSVKPDTQNQDLARAGSITQTFQNSPGYYTLMQQVQQSAHPNYQQASYLQEYIKHRKSVRASPFLEIFYIFKRNAINYFRDKGMIAMRLLQIIIYSLLVGITFLQLKVTPTESIVLNRVIFLQIISISLVGSLSAITFYPQEFPILYKENESKVYRVLTYFIGNILFEIPIYVILTIIFDAINYWLVGLNTSASSFFISLGWLSLASVVSVSFGHFLAALAPSPYSAVILFMPGLMGMTMMTTFFLTNAKSPIGFMKYLSWIHYTLDLLLINQWTTLKSTADCPNCGSFYLSFFQADISIIYVYIIGLVASYFVWNTFAYLITLVRIKVLHM